MIRLGLLGHPVSHSLSPILHAAAAESVGLTVRYDLFDVHPETLPRWLNNSADLAGFNVTAPHKAAVGAWVRRRGPVATRLGVVNTVCCGLVPVGFNTDLYGFAQALGDPPDGPAVVIGAGGAARAVVAALADAGVDDLRICARRPAQCELLLDQLGLAGRVLPWAPNAIDDAGLIIDAIGAPAADCVARLPFDSARPGCRVMALAYGASAAPVVAAARAAGCRAEDGLAMLAWQGIAAFERWTGRRPDPSAVLAALQVV